jgi:Holliday junction resolvase RusA-like endonuclease
MREDIDNIIKEQLDKLETTPTEGKDEITDLVNKQNEKVLKQKKENLIVQIEELKNLGVDIEYDESMSVEELEDIVDGVQF